MARAADRARLDAPRGRTGMRTRPAQPSRDRFGRFTEWVARAMGTTRMQVHRWAKRFAIDLKVYR